MASVRVSIALTRNLGDFNSIKIGGEAEDTVPVPDGVATSDAIRQHFQRLYDLVSDEVDTAMAQAIKELKP